MLALLADAVLALAGLTLILLTMSDVFQSVIVPRAVGRRFRLSTYIWRIGWAFWPKVAWSLYADNEDQREDFLALFAPIVLVTSLAFWGLSAIIGFGTMFWAFRSQIAPPLHTYWAALYFAGASVLTIGYGDIVARSGLARLLSICAGASGLGTFSVTTAYLFALFGTFQTREQFVVTTGTRAGSPPSGVGLLVIASYAGIVDDLDNVLRSGQNWISMLMETHLAYPALAYFRSSHDYESWVGTLGTLLDASILMMTTVQGAAGQARITYAIGRHATHDLAKYFGLGDAEGTPGIDRSEFEAACNRLESAGYTLRDRNDAWERFAALRATYAGRLNALASRFAIPPLQWVGDRSLISTPHVRSQLDDEVVKKFAPTEIPEDFSKPPT